MAENKLNVRITNKVDTTTNWGKATNFIPKAGEIILYSDGGGTDIPKMKVGDGSTKVGSLRFLKGDGEYLPLHGTADSATVASKLSNALSINGKTYDGSTAITVGTIGAAYGGSGKTTLQDSANAFLNALGTASSTPTDADYYISQYASGGTTTTTYHRRPISALYTYMKGKMDSIYQPVGTYLTSVPAGTWAWTNGTSAGPTAKLTIGSNATTIGAVPAASQSQSGIITTASQTVSGNKTVLGNFSVGVRTNTNLYALNISRQSTSDASSMMFQGYINEAANNFQIRLYRYGTDNAEAWRFILNFSNASITSGSTTPITLGSADIPWTAVYAKKFIGGEATTSVAGLMSAADKAILDGLSAVFGGSSSSATGTKGLVPAPASGQQNYVLRGNGSWSQSVVSTTATLTASGWSSSTPHTQTISVSGITTSSKVVIDVNLSGQSSDNVSSILEDWSNVNDIQTGSGTLVAYCYGDAPTVNLPINIIDIR